MGTVVTCGSSYAFTNSISSNPYKILRGRCSSLRILEMRQLRARVIAVQSVQETPVQGLVAQVISFHHTLTWGSESAPWRENSVVKDSL